MSVGSQANPKGRHLQIADVPLVEGGGGAAGGGHGGVAAHTDVAHPPGAGPRWGTPAQTVIAANRLESAQAHTTKCRTKQTSGTAGDVLFTPHVTSVQVWVIAHVGTSKT